MMSSLKQNIFITFNYCNTVCMFINSVKLSNQSCNPVIGNYLSFIDSFLKLVAIFQTRKNVRFSNIFPFHMIVTISRYDFFLSFISVQPVPSGILGTTEVMTEPVTEITFHQTHYIISNIYHYSQVLRLIMTDRPGCE